MPTSRATRVTSAANELSWSTMTLIVFFSSRISPLASTVILREVARGDRGGDVGDVAVLIALTPPGGPGGPRGGPASPVHQQPQAARPGRGQLRVRQRQLSLLWSLCGYPGGYVWYGQNTQVALLAYYEQTTLANAYNYSLRPGYRITTRSTVLALVVLVSQRRCGPQDHGHSTGCPGRIHATPGDAPRPAGLAGDDKLCSVRRNVGQLLIDPWTSTASRL